MQVRCISQTVPTNHGNRWSYAGCACITALDAELEKNRLQRFDGFDDDLLFLLCAIEQCPADGCSVILFCNSQVVREQFGDRDLKYIG